MNLQDKKKLEHAKSTMSICGSIVLGVDGFVLDKDSEEKYKDGRSLKKEYGLLCGLLMKKEMGPAKNEIFESD